MALTPEEIAEKEFAFGLRGYDLEEVRAFLHLVAAEVASGAFGVGSPGSMQIFPAGESRHHAPSGQSASVEQLVWASVIIE